DRRKTRSFLSSLEIRGNINPAEGQQQNLTSGGAEEPLGSRIAAVQSTTCKETSHASHGRSSYGDWQSQALCAQRTHPLEKGGYGGGRARQSAKPEPR